METTLNELLEMMKDYAKNYGLNNLFVPGIEIRMLQDFSGEVYTAMSSVKLFEFHSLPDLIEKLKQ